MSAFHPEHQIISIYYRVKATENITTRISSSPFDFDENQLKIYAEQLETESFRFIDWDVFSEETVTLPIDKMRENAEREVNNEKLKTKNIPFRK